LAWAQNLRGAQAALHGMLFAEFMPFSGELLIFAGGIFMSEMWIKLANKGRLYRIVGQFHS